LFFYYLDTQESEAKKETFLENQIKFRIRGQRSISLQQGAGTWIKNPIILTKCEDSTILVCYST
jgi:hypothetical protein